LRGFYRFGGGGRRIGTYAISEGGREGAQGEVVSTPEDF